MTEGNTMSARHLAGLLTVPIKTEQALKLMEQYRVLTSPNAGEQARAEACKTALRILEQARPPQFSSDEERDQFNQWKAQGKRRTLISKLERTVTQLSERDDSPLAPCPACGEEAPRAKAETPCRRCLVRVAVDHYRNG